MALGHSQRIHFLFCAVCGASSGLLGLSISTHFYQAAPSLAMTSLSVSTLIGLANIIVQERAPGPLRGRVSSVAALSFFGLMPFAGLFVTAIADIISIRHTLFVSALTYACITISLLLANKHELIGASSSASTSGHEPN
jgi:MFS family permease